MNYKAGDRVTLKIFKGSYVIEWINLVRAQITCNRWQQEYANGTRPTHCKTIMVTDIEGIATTSFPTK